MGIQTNTAQIPSSKAANIKIVKDRCCMPRCMPQMQVLAEGMVKRGRLAHRDYSIATLGGSMPAPKRGRKAKMFDLVSVSPLSEKAKKEYVKQAMRDRPFIIYAKTKHAPEYAPDHISKTGERSETQKETNMKTNIISYNEFFKALSQQLKQRLPRDRYDRSLINNSMYQLIKKLQEVNIENPTMEIILLDASYINSIVAEGESVKRAIIGLRNAIRRRIGDNVEIVITREVYDELNKQLKGVNGPKKDEFNRPIMTSVALNELHELIGYGIICLENYTSDENTQQELSVVLEKRNRKRNSRVGKGEVSILKYIKDMLHGLNGISFKILTRDSDIAQLLRGCKGIIKILKGKAPKESETCEAVA